MSCSQGFPRPSLSSLLCSFSDSDRFILWTSTLLQCICPWKGNALSHISGPSSSITWSPALDGLWMGYCTGDTKVLKYVQELWATGLNRGWNLINIMKEAPTECLGDITTGTWNKYWGWLGRNWEKIDHGKWESIRGILLAISSLCPASALLDRSLPDGGLETNHYKAASFKSLCFSFIDKGSPAVSFPDSLERKQVNIAF